MAYITLFPIGSAMRANLFGYRDLHDPWLKQFRDQPQDTLYAMWPGLRRLMGDFTVTDFVKIRPVDLVVTKGYRQNGVVVVGDAFSTSCPAAGTGARKVLVDVERLCNVYIPRWLATPGMGEDEDRFVLRRSGEASLRRSFVDKGLRPALVLDRSVVAVGGAALDQVRAALEQGRNARRAGAAARGQYPRGCARRSAEMGAGRIGAQVALQHPPKRHHFWIVNRITGP